MPSIRIVLIHLTCMLCCIMATELTVGPYTVTLLQDDEKYLGIGNIALRDWTLRSSECPAWLPATMSREGTTFQQWHVDRIKRTASNDVRIYLQGSGQNGLLQMRQNVYGHAYIVGAEQTLHTPTATAVIEIRSDLFAGLPRLSIRHGVEIDGGQIEWILDRHSWQPQNGLKNWRYAAQRWGCEFGGWDAALDSDALFSTEDAMRVNGNFVRLGQGQPRVFGGPSLDYLYGPEGYFALWRDESHAGAYVRGFIRKNPDQSFITMNDQIIAARGQQITTLGFTSLLIIDLLIDDRL